MQRVKHEGVIPFGFGSKVDNSFVKEDSGYLFLILGISHFFPIIRLWCAVHHGLLPAFFGLASGKLSFLLRRSFFVISTFNHINYLLFTPHLQKFKDSRRISRPAVYISAVLHIRSLFRIVYFAYPLLLLRRYTRQPFTTLERTVAWHYRWYFKYVRVHRLPVPFSVLSEAFYKTNNFLSLSVNERSRKVQYGESLLIDVWAAHATENLDGIWWPAFS